MSSDNLCKQIVHQCRLFCKRLFLTYFYCPFCHIQKIISTAQLIQHLLQTTHQNTVCQFYLKRIFYNFNYLNECFSSFKLLKSPCAYRRYSFTSNLYPIPQIVRISSPFSPILLRSFFTCVSMVLASPK